MSRGILIYRLIPGILSLSSLGEIGEPSLLFFDFSTGIFTSGLIAAIISKDQTEGSEKMFSYEGLNERLQARGINKSDLTSILGISSRTIAKIAKGEKISAKTMQKIADYLAKAYEVYGKDIDLSNFYSPIGLQTGGDSPEEVAISIAAEILSVYYGKEDINSHMRDLAKK